MVRTLQRSQKSLKHPVWDQPTGSKQVWFHARSHQQSFVCFGNPMICNSCSPILSFLVAWPIDWHSSFPCSTLSELGLSGSVLSWFESDLSFGGSWRGDMSKLHCLSTGVPQVSVLGPFLFYMYKNLARSSAHCFLLTLMGWSHIRLYWATCHPRQFLYCIQSKKSASSLINLKLSPQSPPETKVSRLTQLALKEHVAPASWPSRYAI